MVSIRLLFLIMIFDEAKIYTVAEVKFKSSGTMEST